MADRKKEQASVGKVASDRATVRSVERAFDILGCFSNDQQTISLTEASQRAELPLSTVSRLLATLETTDFVRRLKDGRYMPGGRLLRIGVHALHGVELFDISEEFLERLADATGEAANLAVPLNDTQALYLRQVQTRKSVRHGNWVGLAVPLEDTAIGRAISGDIGASGFVVSQNTIEQDVTAIAAPIYDASGKIVAAINITAPSYRVDNSFIEMASKLLVTEAETLSSSLGAPDSISEKIMTGKK
ncbi:MAG: IclR family transcriptional regulator [Cognatishimia sp.]